MKFEKVERLPPYVLGAVNELKLEARRRGEDVIDLGFGNPDIPTPPHIVEKLIEAVRDPGVLAQNAEALIGARLCGLDLRLA